MYKLKHTPTGLFYQPSRGNGNLSKKGKIYHNKPTISNTPSVRIQMFIRGNKPNKNQQVLIDHFKIDTKGLLSVDKYFKTPSTDWEIVNLSNPTIEWEELKKHFGATFIEKKEEGDEVINKVVEALSVGFDHYRLIEYLCGIINGQKKRIKQLYKYMSIESILKDEEFKDSLAKQMAEIVRTSKWQIK